MAITETNNPDFDRAVVLWDLTDAFRSLTACSQKLSAGAKIIETPESR